MGCDIHLFVEVRYGDQWENVPDDVTPYGDWGIGRTYLLFSRLAGVRSDPREPVLPIADPRGTPDDVSPEVREYMDPDDGDLHSRSYFTLTELRAADWSMGLEWFRDDFLPRIAGLDRDPDNVRIVFAFDN